MSKIFLSLLFFALFVHSFEVPPSIRFKTIEAPHFYVVVDEKKMDTGFFMAGTLERAYKALDPYFTQKPAKTTVVINDKTDLTNGYATRIPYPHIMIYPVLPNTNESLADYGDWAFELLAHEYAHILTFEGARGFYRYLRPVFGSIISPNGLMPRWWKEGVSVYLETQLSNGGRLRSNYQESLIRSFVLNDSLNDFKIFEINEFLHTWPEGNRPYLFGSLIWAQMAAEESPLIVKQLHDRQAGRVPFFINTPAEDYLGSDYEKFFEDTLFMVEEKILRQIDVIKQLPESIAQAMDPKSKYSSSPSISSDGKYLAYLAVSRRDVKEVKIIEKNKNNNFVILDSGQIENANQIDDIYEESDEDQHSLDGPIAGNIQRIVWLPKTYKIIYDKIDSFSPAESFSDLFLFDFTTKKTERLTSGERAREATPSPDGGQVAFVKLDALKTRLAVLDLKTRKVKILWAAGLQERISNPSYLDSNTIIFSLRKPNTEEHLVSYDIASGTMKPMLTEFPEARYPNVLGSSLYFSSTKNGIRNIYLNDLKEGSSQAITHIYTGSFSYALDPVTKDLYYTKQTAKGPQIHFSSQTDLTKTPEELPKISRIYANQFPDKPKTPVVAEPKGNYPVREYSPYSYLWPQYWIPFVATSSSDNRFLLQAQTSGFDPLKKHVYSLDLVFDSATGKTSIDGTYLNQMYKHKFGLVYNEYTTYFVFSSSSATYTTRSFFVQPNIWHMSKNATLQVAAKQIGARTGTTQYNREGGGFMFSYADLERTNSLSTPFAGQHYYLGMNQYLKSGDNLQQTQFLFGTSQYWPDLLLEDHVVYFKLDALYSNDRISPILGMATNSLLMLQDPLVPYFVMRGYRQGQFVGETMINPKFEYRFPMREINRGNSTHPIFLRRLHGAIISDGVFLDGRAYHQTDGQFKNVSTNQSFWNMGFEFRFEMNVAYQIPLTAIIGIYNPLSGAYASSSSASTSFQVGSFF